MKNIFPENAGLKLFFGIFLAAFGMTITAHSFPADAPPAAPTGLTATPDSRSASLSWTASTGATSYNIKRSTTSGGPYTTITTGTTGTTYNYIGGLTNGTTYYYVVSAVNAGGESANSNQASVTPAVPAPTGLAATAGNTSVQLLWNYGYSGTSYNVKRSTTSGGPYTTIATVNNGFPSYNDNSVNNGTTYYYVVSAVNGGDVSVNSAQVSATPSAAPPAAPTGLSASPFPALLGVLLQWNASTNATSYTISRATVSGGPYTVVASNVVGTAYNNYSLNYSTTYYYVVSAVNANGQSANSAQASVTTPVPPPAAPTGLSATAGNNEVSLSWNASTNATSYFVNRATVSGGPYTAVGIVFTTTHTDTPLTNGTTYYYVVKANNASGLSPNSSQVSATPSAPAGAPPAPTGLTATAGNGRVVLSWNASTGATSYIVKRANGSDVSYTTIASSVTNTTYTDTDDPLRTGYPYYVVRAVNANGQSGNSAWVRATPAASSTSTGTGTTGTSTASNTATTSTDNSTGNTTNTANSYVKNNPDGSQTLTGHVPLVVKNGTAILQSHASLNINAQIIMPLANQSQLSTLLQNLYDPTNSSFHQFLTPTQFAQQFAPSSIDQTLVGEYLNQEGITVTASNGAVLNVTGPVSAFEQAFGLHINNYQKADGTLFYAPDTDPTIPATIAGKVLAVGGLDNLAKYQSHSQASVNALPNAVGTGPGGYLAPSDVMSAYNLTSVPVNGSGQNIALFELDGYSNDDITAYESNFGLPVVPLQNVLVDGFNGVPNYTLGAPEVTLDVETVAAFAPGSNILVYEAPNTTQSWIDEWSKIANDDKASVISCSWGEAEGDSATLSFDNAIFQQMAAQGQAVFVATGDNGAYDGGGTTLSVDEPASQPFATAVGVSSLTTNPDGTYNSETASVLGGGGVSAYQTIPSYQTTAASQANKAALVSTSMRNLPDVVLSADASRPYAFYINGSWSGYYGSSISSPVWASFMARVNQGVGAPVGSVNSMLYQLAQSSTNTSDFNGITIGNNGYYPAEPGFNDATGIGSFNGFNLYNDLVQNVQANTPSSAASASTPAATTPPAAPTGLSATAGNGQVTLSWPYWSGTYNIKRATVSGGPYTTITTQTYYQVGFPSQGTYIDSSVSNGTTYYYVISYSPLNSEVESANSAEVSATPLAPPAAPTGLTATAGNAQVVLSWTASTGAASYNVKRATVSGGPYTTIATNSSTYINPTSYTDTTVTNGTTYYYVVSAVNATGESVNSAEVSATPVAPPAAPTGLTATAGNAQVVLSWTAVTGATSYNVKIPTTVYGTYTTIASSVTDTTYTNTSLTNGTTYYYVVSAVGAGGESVNSAEASATPAAPVPSTPTGLNATPGDGQVSLSWTASDGATSYNVERSTVDGGPFTSIANQAGTSYTDTSVTDGTTYYYVLAADNASGESPNSAEASATPAANSGGNTSTDNSGTNTTDNSTTNATTDNSVTNSTADNSVSNTTTDNSVVNTTTDNSVINSAV